MKLELIDNDEMLDASLISKYPFKKVKDAMEEACKYQRDADQSIVDELEAGAARQKEGE